MKKYLFILPVLLILSAAFLGTASAYTGAYAPTSNMIGYWKMEGSSTDTSSNANNGTDTDVSYVTAPSGMYGSVASFNGTTSKIFTNVSGYSA